MFPFADFVVEAIEHQNEQLKASYAELQSTLISEREHSADISNLLVAERQTATSAHEQCMELSEKLSEMEKTLADTENRLQAVLYVSCCSCLLYSAVIQLEMV